jgi:glycosyltransferase involved in cell wall biosynthesis
MKKVLIISEGPPPLGSTPVEGGALRAWGLAKGLISHGMSVTVAYRSTFALADDHQDTPIPKGIQVATWDGETIDALLQHHQVIIMRYAMGEAWAITQKLSPEHIYVADSYVPISIEVSARNSNHKDEITNYLRLQESSMLSMRRADYILYASPAQLLYYLGYLGGINKLNPATYQELAHRLMEVPYGVDLADKPKSLPAAPSSPTLLWYGAFYSWFDMESLIPALQTIKKDVPGFRLLIAGAKNPYNQDPGLLSHYEKTVEALSVLGDTVEYVPWASFEERFNIYSRASAIVTFNHLGLENKLAWRTRLMDYVLADRPIITNGGDPLGDDLIKRGVAFASTAEQLATTFRSVIATKHDKATFRAAAERYSWQAATKALADQLQSPTRMKQVPMVLSHNIFSVWRRRLVAYAGHPKRLLRYIRAHGVMQTIRRIVGR